MFIITSIIFLFLFTKREIYYIKNTYDSDKTKVMNELSLKYKKSLEQMYDEHIFSITHEIRSPLAVINANAHAQIEDLRKLYSEMYKLQVNNDISTTLTKDMKYRISIIETQVDIIESFIANIVNYGNYISSKTEEEFKIINLRQYLSTIVTMIPTFSRNMKVFGKNIHFVEDGKDFDLIYVPINANDLTRILINVCKNAGDAIHNAYRSMKDINPTYEPKLSIQCIKTKNKDSKIILKDKVVGPFGNNNTGNSLYLVIEDNGPGISNENKHKIFTYGFSTKKNTVDENLGMGLHISMNLAQNNDISIFFDTNEHGTRFIIGFPNILFFQNDKKQPSLGWVADDTDIYISNDSKELFTDIVKTVVNS
jgi:signal transduction histidine kinase